MKKRVFKIILALVLILVILFVVNLVRNYMILKDIMDYSSSLKENGYSNYYFKIHINDGDYETEIISEYYYKDNVMLMKHSFMDNETIDWFNFNTNEYEMINNGETSVDNNLFEIYEEPNYIYTVALLSTKSDLKGVLLNYMFKPIMIENNCYKIKLNNTEYYINKDIKMIEKSISEAQEMNDTMSIEKTETLYELKTDCVTDKDVERPIQTENS